MPPSLAPRGQLFAWRSLAAARARLLRAAKDGNVLGREAKVRKLLVIQISKPCAYAVLRRVVLSPNESAHQARSDFQVPGGTCSHASPQNCMFMIASCSFCCREPKSARELAHHPDASLRAHPRQLAF